MTNPHEKHITKLVKLGDADALCSVFEDTGYLSNRHSHTSKDLGRAIMALAPLLDTDTLASVVHGAAWNVVVTSLSDPNTGVSKEGYSHAERIAAATLAKIDRGLLERYIARIDEVSTEFGDHVRAAIACVVVNSGVRG